MKISDVDKNFKLNDNLNKENIYWTDANNKCFSLFGIFYDDTYKRLDSELAKRINEGVYQLHKTTSGGRLCFETDSPYVAISVKGLLLNFSHMPMTGTAGFDIYIYDNGEFEYYKTFIPPIDGKNEYVSIVEFDSLKNRKLMLHFPLYSEVSELYIGLDENSNVEAFNPYNELKPVVYYGSSITHGGCASRPGNNYPAIVSIKTLTDFICLGFSGNAHGEAEIANYISDLDISAFVMEYDHNDVMNPENLKDKHFSFYKTVRSKHPDIPIIIFSAPYSSYLKNEMSITHKIVYDSFLKAKENDENVFFIDGQKVFGEEYRTCCSVDGTHPNDFGFVRMADAVLDILKK